MSTPRIDFEWDPAKAATNIQKHGITFEVSASVFLDPLAVSIPDNEHADRWVTQGLSRESQLLIVVHTYEETAPERAAVRIISARRATRREKRVYEQGL